MTTATNKNTETIKRPGELGVHSLDHLNVIVPDLSVAEHFYTSFGLNVSKKEHGLEIYTDGSDHCWYTLTEGERKKLGYLSFGVFDEDFDPMVRRLNEFGVQLTTAPTGVDSDGLWFHGHDDVLMEVKIAEKSSPTEKTEFTMLPALAGEAAAPLRSDALTTRPRRLTHLALFTTDIPGAIDFYSQVLGMRLSDRSGDGVCFMHGIHGSDHHLVAFAKSDAPGLHHSSWDVGSIDDIGRGAMQMAELGFTEGWGLGRHVLGSNYFHYVRDPWGSYAEYSADIDYIPATQDWEAGDFPPEESFYLWGPELPEDFVHNYEA